MDALFETDGTSLYPPDSQPSFARGDVVQVRRTGEAGVVIADDGIIVTVDMGAILDRCAHGELKPVEP